MKKYFVSIENPLTYDGGFVGEYDTLKKAEEKASEYRAKGFNAYIWE